ncbi:hypothetical protein QYS48_29090 [Marivirga arenosa]|uniref:Platelet-activating factor acetylhydrolase n=1 Tax=Marivirga arenosa TaxID=3059076 RepID=A0AA51NAL1_9BACT|nr:hypothetical protein [Marivirga sp. ABR2-2]WMN07546.1 hypothetical protein QYS48_29090 [Marivirga sp. ABR2-2]
MRLFEIILLLCVTILPFIKRPLLQRIKSNYLFAILGSVLILHLLIEGFRWQMFPAYLLVVVLVWRIKAVDISQKAKFSFLRGLGYFLMLIVLSVSWLLPIVLPVFDLPKPTGEYKVGSESFYVKTNLDELITEDPTDKRELMVKVWYPVQTEKEELEAERYVDQASREGFATKYGLPASALNYLDQVETYVYKNAQVADGKFPVILFSHGYGSKATAYYALLTELASHGYVIINMNHTYESLGVTFPDGRKKYFDYDYQRKISAHFMEKMGPVIDAFKDSLSYDQRHPIVRDAIQDYFEGHIQDRWAKDMVFITNLLNDWNNKGLLKGKLDLDRIGALGHSVGGGTAGNLAMKDNRIKAAVNLDGIQWGSKIDTVYHIPYLYVSADWPADHEDINSHIYKKKSTDYFYEAKLLKSAHANFMDIPFMVTLNSVAGTGEINPYLGNRIITELTISFFDRHLRGLETKSPERIAAEQDLLEMEIFKGDSLL